MKFLEYVADDILQKYSDCLNDVVVVFPNKRASLFLNKYLLERIGHAFWSPRYITISELFRMQSELTVADPIKTNCMMHKAFAKCTGSIETLDKFWGWGQMILADFDDLDKNMASAELVFSNVSDLHALDSVEYLDDNQRKAISKFFQQFSDDPTSALKKKFLELWSKLHDIYCELNRSMREEGLAYEGALYREVAERADTLEWQHKHYLFVGFNMIQKSEQMLFKSMKHKGLAHFYWDFDRYYLDNPTQEAGTFISEYLVRFPNELDIKNDEIYCNLAKKKDVTYLSASTENIQARYIADWLHENNRIDAGERTAIVLGDEQILKSVIHYLPKELSGKANITVGYPLAQSPIATLVSNFIELHISGYKAQTQVFMAKYVQAILRHPYLHLLTPLCTTLSDKLRTERIFFPKEEDLCLDESLTLLFKPIDDSMSEVNTIIMQRLCEIVARIGKGSEAARLEELAYNGIAPEDVTLSYEEQFMQESVFQMSKVVNRIRDLVADGTLHSTPHTLHSLLNQIIQATTMPFHGEPAVGVQIMGVLETRNLDFDHVLMLSCNEGNLPKGISESSLIPHSIRKAHQLTTIDKKVAIYAYYFYRLLQRCQDMSIAYNSSTEDGHTGQMSRFMLQLMVENTDINLTLNNLTATQLPRRVQTRDIPKDANILKVLHEKKSLSPSALSSYLRCPIQFFFQNIAGIKEPEAEDVNDLRALGLIFHRASELLYTSMMKEDGLIQKEVITKVLEENSHATILHYVDNAFSDIIFKNKKPHYDGLQLIGRGVVTKWITNLLKADEKNAPFHIVDLEGKAYECFNIKTTEGMKKLSIGGVIDRVDRVRDADGKEVIRVVDYKTGSHVAGPFLLEDIFVKDNIEKGSHYYLQAMIYSIIARHNDKLRHYDDEDHKPLNPHLLPAQPALLFIQDTQRTENPVLTLGTTKEHEYISDIQDCEEEFRKHLQTLIEEIYNPTVAFHQTVNTKRCEHCSFHNLCRN